MISIPLYSLLFVYLIFLVIFSVFFILSIYHIVGTGMFSKAGLIVTFLVFLIVVLTLYVTFISLADVDWRQPLLEIGTGFNIF